MIIAKNMSRIASMLKPLVLLFVAGTLLTGCATLPKDNAQLTEFKFESLMGTRYTEILLVFGNAITHNFMAGVYNTMGLNGANPGGGGDSRTPHCILARRAGRPRATCAGEHQPAPAVCGAGATGGP